MRLQDIAINSKEDQVRNAETDAGLRLTEGSDRDLSTVTESQEEGQELSDHDRDSTLEEEQQEEGG